MEQTGNHEKVMAQKNSAVIMFKNIDKEDYSHSFDGIPFLVKKGEIVPLQFPVARLLAKHLAMKILRRKKDTTNPKDIKIGNLYPQAEIVRLTDMMLTETIEMPQEATQKTQGQIAKEKTEELKKTMGSNTPAPADKKMEKKDVIKELTKRGVKFNARLSLEKLYEILLENEKNAD